MLNLTYLNDTTAYAVEFTRVSDSVVQVKGDVPTKTNGFTLTREGKSDNWDYSAFTTVYKEDDGYIQFSNDGSVAKTEATITFTCDDHLELSGGTTATVKIGTDISALTFPTVTSTDEEYKFSAWSPAAGTVTDDMTIRAVEVYEHIDTLEEVQAAKVTEMNETQQRLIQDGVLVQLSDGTYEQFTLTDQDQTSLIELQAMAQAGQTQIPWHTADHEDHCKYYSAEDMTLITTAAIAWVSYQVTLFRDIRIWVNSLTTKDEVAAVYYTIPPEKYQSEVLKDMIAQMG